MARKTASRKYQITINNPQIHGFDHPTIKNILAGFSGLEYWCMCDEIGKEGTPHTHVYVVYANAVMFATLQKRFYGSHIEPANGSNQENRDYIRKEGKWTDDEKKETNLGDTFEESGELPADKASKGKESSEIYQMIKGGANNFEIMEAIPNAINKLDKIDRARQVFINNCQKNTFRKLDNTYLWGAPGVGKTRSVLEKYVYENVYRVTNYTHPFDGYKGEDVLLLDEFYENIPINELLCIIDGYPLMLPCRYADKQACFTKVFIISNKPLEEQYKQEQIHSPVIWQALLRRINQVVHMLPPSDRGLPDWAADLPD